MKHARGMTLIEVLAATMLLALIAAVCLPMLTWRARPATTQHDITLEDLARIVNRALNEPSAYGLDFTGGAALIDGSRLQLTSVSTPTDVYVRVLRPIQPEADHVWLVFESGAVSVSRWLSAESIGNLP